MVTNGTSGADLEARVQRLFLAQGLLAERRLWPAATADRRMLATDIDVLVSEYATGFHLTRRHAECKGPNLKLLDRILWLNGVRTLLDADATYLVGPDIDMEAAEFARMLHVQLLSVKALAALESSLNIPADVWPCRSDLAVYAEPREHWQSIGGKQGGDAPWDVTREILTFLEVDGWLRFRYRHLNRALRLFGTLASRYAEGGFDEDWAACAAYSFSSLVVRFAQYLLAVCADVSVLLPLDLRKYIMDRLVFGDNDPSYSSGLVKKTLDWVQRAASDKGSTIPPVIDPARLYSPPEYAEEFVQLIERLLAANNDARYLPIASEVNEFGHLGVEGQFPRLRAAAAAGDLLAATARGFLVRAFGVQAKLAEPAALRLTGQQRDKPVTGGEIRDRRQDTPEMKDST